MVEVLSDVSIALTLARCINRYTIPEVAKLAGVMPDHVFDAENFLEDAPPCAVLMIAQVLGVDINAKCISVPVRLV